MNLRYAILLISVFFLTKNISAQNMKDSILIVLNKAMENKETYVRVKEQQIQNLKQRLLINDISLAQQYDINLKLYKEYEKYKVDSAVKYIKKNQKIAQLLGQIDLKCESDILLASSYSTKGMYIESKQILENIDRKKLSIKLQSLFYNTYCVFYSHYGQSNDENIYYTNSSLYRDSLLMVLDKGTLQYEIEHISKRLYLFNDNKMEKALINLLEKTTDKEPERAFISYLLGYLYKQKGKTELAIKYYSIAAICDITNCIKDNASLQGLALAYYESGNIELAYKFNQSAMNDAMFCNVRYRAMEVFAYYPIINAAYQTKEKKQKEELQVYLILISILSTVLLLGIIYIYKQVKKLGKTRQELYHTNLKLSRLNIDLQNVNVNLQEANRIKEEYIAHFFDLCSTYIDKLENYRKLLIKKASNNQIEELFKTLKSSHIVDQELEDLYKNFDSIFLKIYPTFIEDFNKLLMPDEQIIPKQGELLNTELRIFALIRLGIKDSAKIASFLRYSLRTVYNYRTKVRNKSAVLRDDFEDYVEKIGSYQAKKML